MEMVQAEIEADEANITQQPNSNLSPFMETVRFEVESPRGELEAVRAENQRLHIKLGNCASEKELLKQKLVEVQSQLEVERADREEIQAESSELKQSSVPATTLSEKLTPDTATILSQLRVRRKKSKTDLADLEALLEILES
jgi:hypothetical protein